MAGRSVMSLIAVGVHCGTCMHAALGRVRRARAKIGERVPCHVRVQVASSCVCVCVCLCVVCVCIHTSVVACVAVSLPRVLDVSLPGSASVWLFDCVVVGGWGRVLQYVA